MKKTILLDLDETLINTLFRQYSVLKAFCDTKKIEISNFENYIQFRKTNQCSNSQYIEPYLHLNGLLEEFRRFYVTYIESVEFLKLDSLIVDLDLLKKVSNQFNLVILSLRSNEINSTNQLAQLGLLPYFSNVYFLKHAEKNPKTAFISQMTENLTIHSFAGDSEGDYLASKENDVPFIGLETGLFSLPFKISLRYKTVNEYLSTLM